ncbi:hypothetical protein Tco_0710727 [Tanacetum coccineum]
MATFEVLDELMEITGSTELHKRMRFWFVQEIAEEDGFWIRRRNLRRSQADQITYKDKEAQGAELRGVGTGSQERPSKPALLPRVTLPPALTRKNINVWKTMVKRSGTDEEDEKSRLQKESHLFSRTKQAPAQSID